VVEAEEGAGVGNTICDKAEELQAAAVVLSSHSKSRLAELLTGSMSNFLTHNCPRPVIVLHPKVERLVPKG
jgi:nucleotide-binding universal stress UspA family protein